MIDIGWCNSGLGSGFSLKGTSCNLQGGSEIGPGLRLPVSVANVEPRRCGLEITHRLTGAPEDNSNCGGNKIERKR